MCLDDNQILALIEGTITVEDRAAIDAHLDECETCRHLVGVAIARTTGRIGPYADTVSAREGTGLAARLALRGSMVSRYLILDKVGAGGMGVVYAAYDPELDRKVAVKVLHTGGPGRSESLRGRVLREAQSMARLTHPNVVTVYDVGVADEQVFLVMEFIQGSTLRAWLSAEARPWRAVLDAFRQAGLGLAAAHAAGLVHRDFKPDNVLVDPAGRVLVTDFGLARLASSGPASEGEALDSPIAAAVTHTSTGTIMGTPAYMAPEQIDGGATDPRGDVFSFCVALYEALYRQHPFAGATMAELRESILRGSAAPPPGSLVPAWVHRALVRGLAFHPDDRYPSLDALITRLGQDPAARRRLRWRNAGITLAAAGLLAIAAAGWAKGSAVHDPCEHPERQLAGVWDDDIRGRVRAAFVATGRPYAESTVSLVTARLDRYAADWAKMQGEVCEASRGTAPERELLGARAVCMDRRRSQLEALTTLFVGTPDVKVLDNAVQAAAELYPLAYCADAEALTARVPPPEDPALRARIAALQPRVDRLEALEKAGKYKEGLALGTPLLAETEAIPYAPLRGQLELIMGGLYSGSGDLDAAKAELLKAAASASAGKDDVIGAMAWVQLLIVVGDSQGRFDEASVIRSLGPTALARVHDDVVKARWLNAEGIVFSRMGKYAEAKEAFERTLTFRENAPKSDQRDVAAVLVNLSTVAFNTGDWPIAKARLDRALPLIESALGPDHPDVGVVLGNLANLVLAMGDYPLAASTQRRALAIREKALGPDAIEVGMSLNNLGNALFGDGNYQEAKATQERALAIFEKRLGPDHLYVTYARAGLGRAEVRLGQLDSALPLLEQALSIREKLTGSSHPEVAEPLLYLGELHLARGKPEVAAPLLERALALDDPEIKLEIQLSLAEALWQLGKARPRARELAEHARADYERSGHRPGLARATRWLAEHDVAAKAGADGGGGRTSP